MSHAAPSTFMPLSCREEACEVQAECEAKGRLLALMSEAHKHQVVAHKEGIAHQKRKRMDFKEMHASEMLDLKLELKDANK